MGDGSHMNTMDVRIKITQDIMKESDQFSEDSHGGQFSEDSAGEDKIIKSDIRLVVSERNILHSRFFILQEES